MKKRQSAKSKDFVEAIVFAGTDPTGQAVGFLFPLEDVAPSGTPVVGQWRADGWDGQKAVAQCLVGPGGTVTLDVGIFDVFVQWTEAPEVPLILTGQLEVF
jgi:hypothetical protein